MNTLVSRITLPFLVAGVLFGFAVAQEPTMPPPDAIPANAAEDRLHEEAVAVHDSLCRDIAHAAQILSDTGTLGQAVPIVMNMTGLEAAEIESQEQAICNGDPSALTLPELRAENRTAIWLVEVHLAAMEEVLPAE